MDRASVLDAVRAKLVAALTSLARGTASAADHLEALGRGPALAAALVLYLAVNALPALVFQYTTDGIENLDLARNLAAGRGFVSTFRTYYWGPDGFPQPPHLVRAPLYPLLAGGAFTLVPDPRTLQVLNLLLGAFALALLHVVLARRLGRPVAALSTLLLAASAAYGLHTRRALSEAIALLALVAALAVADHRGRAPLRHVGLGLWIGLAYLARPATLPLGAALALFVLARGQGLRRPRAVLPAALAIAAGALLGFLPVLLLNLRWGLPPWFSPAGPFIDSFSFRDFMWSGFGFDPPGPVEVLKTAPAAVAAKVARHALMHARSLLFDPAELGYLVLLWPAAVLWLRNARGSGRRLAVLLASLAVLNILFYVLSWAIHSERFRFTSFVFLLPLLVAGLRWAASRLAARPAHAFWGLGLLLVVASAQHNLVSQAPLLAAARQGYSLPYWYPARDATDAIRAAAWLEERLPSGSPIAATDAWLFLQHLGHPTALLPSDLPPAEYARFLRAYRVRAVVNLEGKGAGAPAEALEAGIRLAAGVPEPVRFGPNAVYLLSGPSDPALRARANVPRAPPD